jgi:hypothetical protein
VTDDEVIPLALIRAVDEALSDNLRPLAGDSQDLGLA